MGLLDFLNQDDARLGLGLLAAGGPSAVPLNFGQRVAGAMQGVDAQTDARMKRAYLQSQMDENNSQTKARQAQNDREARINSLVLNRLAGGGGPAGGSSPGPVAAPSYASNYGGGVPVSANPTPVLGQSASAGLGSGGAAADQPSGFPFGLNDIALLSTLGAKGADKLFDMYKYSTDGVKREAGNYYKDPITGAVSYLPKLDNGMTVDGRGNVSQAPGYSAANAGIKGAEANAVEAAKYPFNVGADRARQHTQASLDLMQVVGPDNNTYFVPRSVVAGGGVGGGFPASATGGTPGISIGGAGPTAGGGFMAGRNPITQQSAIALNDNWIKNAYQPTVDAGKTANDLQASIQAIRNIDVKTGWGSEAKANAAGMLEGLGIASGNAAMYASNAQKFQSVAMDKLMTTLQAQKGPQTEGDSDRAKQTFVALKNTPEANAFILDFAEAKANMDRRRAEYYQQALPLAQKSGDLPRIDREWRKIQGSIWADPVLQRWSK